jgi:hypothetical protein
VLEILAEAIKAELPNTLCIAGIVAIGMCLALGMGDDKHLLAAGGAVTALGTFLNRRSVQ